ncbi:MAG: dihydrolipoamide acetyltransferase [Phycisphaerae bacterium]|nr:dihydrolipoamide acetyltransferase [Phycisphaerae bacterium]
MPIDITMPRLSDTMETGTIVKWHVSAGDAVSAGDVIADVETDKATMEMQCYDDGTMVSIEVNEGSPVAVGTVVAVMAEEDEEIDAATPPSSPPPSMKEPPPAPQAGAEAPPAATPAVVETVEAQVDEPAEPPLTMRGHVRISPVARRIAEEHGVDPASLSGSGPMGRIVKRDVLAAIGISQETAAAVPPGAGISQASPASSPGSSLPATPVDSSSTSVPVKASDIPAPSGYGLQPWSEPLSGMRQTIARRLVESKTSIPHYQVSMVFDMDPMVEMRSQLNEQLAQHEVKLSMNDLVVRCCALAMYTNPLMNASWGGDCINYHGDVNIGVAISLPPERGGGLVVATIRNADRKSLRVINQESKELSKKARTKGLTIDEMADSTFTVSNLGMFGIDNFTAIINPPNSAILAVGAVQQKPVVRNGEVVVGHEMTATLSNDHRVVDGATAARYLSSLKELIENPGMALV